MRPLFAAISILALGLTGAGFGGTAQAQSLPNVVTPGASPDNNDGAIAVPPAPAIVPEAPSIQATPVPPMPQTPGMLPDAPPANADNGGSTQPAQPPDASTGQDQGQSQAAAPLVQAPDIAPIPPNTWLPAQTAKIGVLDKIDGSVSVLSIPVGGQSVVGDLQVSVQACMIRPPDQVPDAAVFVALQNTQDSSAPPNYRGWLVRSAPGAAVAGDASETFRVIACD